VILGAFRYEWSVLDEDMRDRIHRNPPVPPERWLFQYYKTTLDPVRSTEAVNGAVTSAHRVEL